MTEYSTNYNYSNQLLSFKKSIASNNRQAIDKYLSQIKNLPEDFLNQALFWCIQNYKVQQQTDECLHVLLRYNSETTKSKANPNCQINLQTPLIAACKKGQLSLVKRLIQNGAKPDLTNSENKHPLQFVLNSRQQNYDVAEYLIAQIHSVNIVTKNKHPILLSVEKEYCRIFKALLDKGSDLVFEDGNLLHFIMKQKFKNLNKKKKFLKQLTTKHYLFTQLDKNGKMPIEYEDYQEIKTFYTENFKIKKVPEPSLINSVEKISNNSSVFINFKPSKKDQRSLINDKKKNLTQSGSLSNKPKEANRQTRLNKQLKDDEASLGQQGEEKSQADIQDDEKYTQKHVKIAINLPNNKKTITNSSKANVSSITNNTIFKEPSISNVNNSTTNKLKSKYSSIGPKTQTNLKTFNKRTDTFKNDPKKFLPTNNNKNIQTKKRSLNEDEKKQYTIKKIPICQQKNIVQPSINQQLETHKQEIDQENQKLSENMKELEVNQRQSNHYSLIDDSKQRNNEFIFQALTRQNQFIVQTLENIQFKDQITLPEKKQRSDSVRKSQWEIALESCEKLMQQFIIKEENQITDLKELKFKLNQIFSQFTTKAIPQQQQNVTQVAKLRQIKILTNQSSKSNFISFNKTPIVQKQLPKAKQASMNILTEQIQMIEENCSKTSQQKTKCVDEAINLISKKIHHVLQSGKKDKIQVSVQIYGSRANGLQIQTSDIDLLIVCNINAGVKDLMLQLQRSGAFNCSQINEAKFLVNTSMPIMKLSLNSSFKYLNIDLTFQVRGHTGIRCTSLIKQFIAAQDLLKPLVVTLKTLLNQYELCDTYTGGLGSYSLTLMTIALLQFTEIKKTRENLGEIFLQFLLFYGFQMDYVCQAIIIHPPGFNERPAFSIYQLPYSLDLTPKLIIYDPLNPVNNVGRATYRIVQLKKLFKIWYVKLRTQLSGRKDSFLQLMNMKDELLQKTSTIQE